MILEFPASYLGYLERGSESMCSPALCETCGKVTWVGCGEHIETALAGFGADQLCRCDSGAPAGVKTS